MYLVSLFTRRLLIVIEVTRKPGVLQSRATAQDLLEALLTLRRAVEEQKNKFEEELRSIDELDEQSAHPIGLLGTVPEAESTGGRPRLVVSQEAIEELFRSMGSWRRVSTALGISERTLRRRRQEIGLPIGSQIYSDVDDNELDAEIAAILQHYPDSGEVLVMGALNAKGVYVQRWRVRLSLSRVDPVNRSIRRRVPIIRRTYSVRAPNDLWLVARMLMVVLTAVNYTSL